METMKFSTNVEQLAHYRHLVTTADGQRILLRPLAPQDHDALAVLMQSLRPEALQYFRTSTPDAAILANWAENTEMARVFPLGAFAGDTLVGNATLHLGGGATRHIAEIRVFLAQEYRRRGIGTAMLKTQIEIARKLGLYQLMAEIAESRPQVVHAFEHLDFERQCVLRDYLMTPDGDTLDLILMVKYLKRSSGDF